MELIADKSTSVNHRGKLASLIYGWLESKSVNTGVAIAKKIFEMLMDSDDTVREIALQYYKRIVDRYGESNMTNSYNTVVSWLLSANDMSQYEKIKNACYEMKSMLDRTKKKGSSPICVGKLTAVLHG